MIAGIYQHLLSDRKFGLTHNLLATKVMPSLIPHTISPGLSIDQVSSVLIIQMMMLMMLFVMKTIMMVMMMTTMTMITMMMAMTIVIMIIKMMTIMSTLLWKDTSLYFLNVSHFLCTYEDTLYKPVQPGTVVSTRMHFTSQMTLKKNGT